MTLQSQTGNNDIAIPSHITDCQHKTYIASNTNFSSFTTNEYFFPTILWWFPPYWSKRYRKTLMTMVSLWYFVYGLSVSIDDLCHCNADIQKTILCDCCFVLTSISRKLLIPMRIRKTLHDYGHYLPLVSDEFILRTTYYLQWTTYHVGLVSQHKPHTHTHISSLFIPVMSDAEWRMDIQTSETV